MLSSLNTLLPVPSYNVGFWFSGDFVDNSDFSSLSFPQNDFVVETSLVGTVFNGLSHLSAVTERGQFIVGLLRGLGGNLNHKTRQEFAKEVRRDCGTILDFGRKFSSFSLVSCIKTYEALVHDMNLEGNQSDYLFVYFLYICSC